MRFVLLCVMTAGLWGCADKGGGETGGAADGADGTDATDGGEELDPATVPLNGTCPQELRFGRFEVESNEDYAHTFGEIADGVVPTNVLTEMLVDGECTIWRRENPFCDPGCEPGFTCDLSGTCVPYPLAQDVGLVTISGLTSEVAMEAVQPNNEYFDTSLSKPPWASRAVLTLQTEGGPLDPVTLHAVAPDPFVMRTEDWYFVPGESLTVEWEPPLEGARTEVVLSMRIDQHGLTPSSLTCTFADDGSGTIPAAAFSKLVEFGITGFPTGELERRTSDHADLSSGGCAELSASESRLPLSIEIEGYTPCRRDADCPEGQECNELLERCE